MNPFLKLSNRLNQIEDVQYRLLALNRTQKIFNRTQSANRAQNNQRLIELLNEYNELRLPFQTTYTVQVDITSHNDTVIWLKINK